MLLLISCFESEKPWSSIHLSLYILLKYLEPWSGKTITTISDSLNSPSSLNCFTAWNAAPLVYPAKIPSDFTISLAEWALSSSETFINLSIISKFVTDGIKFLPLRQF